MNIVALRITGPRPRQRYLEERRSRQPDFGQSRRTGRRGAALRHRRRGLGRSVSRGAGGSAGRVTGVSMPCSSPVTRTRPTTTCPKPVVCSAGSLVRSATCEARTFQRSHQRPWSFVSESGPALDRPAGAGDCGPQPSCRLSPADSLGAREPLDLSPARVRRAVVLALIEGTVRAWRSMCTASLPRRRGCWHGTGEPVVPIPMASRNGCCWPPGRDPSQPWGAGRGCHQRGRVRC